MADETKINKEETTVIKDLDAQKRKRINKFKTAIIVTIIIMFLLPTILCIMLGIRLYRLENQVENLLSTYSSKTEAKEETNNDNSGQYAYASESNVDDKEKNEYDIDNESDIVGDNNEYIDEENISKEDGMTDIPSTLEDNSGVDSEAKDETNEIDENVEADKTDNRDPNGIYYDKQVYLTFDDGPTKNTDLILDILAEYDVKGTFFVIGDEDEKAKERYRRIVDEGHTLGVHSYSHDYREIYKSLENFDKDFTKLWKLLYDTTGYMPTLYRFPGGSLNFVEKSKMEEFIAYLNDKDIIYFDWNVVNGDAEGKDYTEEQMIDKVLNGVERRKTSVVLMHDSLGKNKTIDTLPMILEALISGGAEVLPLDEDVPLIQQIKATSVNNT